MLGNISYITFPLEFTTVMLLKLVTLNAQLHFLGLELGFLNDFAMLCGLL